MAACAPTTGRGFSFIWYVATSGADTNVCEDPVSPCLTVAGALEKARSTNSRLEREHAGETITLLHTINVAAGEYAMTELHEGFYPFANVDINVTINGAGRASTFFNATNVTVGIRVIGDVSVTLRNFTIRDLVGTGSCIAVDGAAVVTIENVTVRNCQRTGIANTGTGSLALTNVNVGLSPTDPGGSGGEGVFNGGDLTIEGGRFFRNEGVGILSLGSLVMNGGVVELNDRSGMLIAGTATLNGVVLSDNGQDGGFDAGLNIGEGTATVTDTTITNNQYGVSLTGEAANLELVDSVVNSNPRSGILVSSGELSLLNTTVARNGSSYVGTGLIGGISINAGARATLQNSQVSGNLNGGIDNYGELFVIESVLAENDGGLPVLFNEIGATATLERSLIADNIRTGEVAAGEHAVLNVGTMNIVNTTISGNLGNGLSTSGPLQLAFSTIAFNVDIGFLTSESAEAAPWLAGNLIVGNGTDCYVPGPGGPGPAAHDGANMDSDGTCDFPLTVTIGTGIGPLQDNGGPTLTHNLGTDSPAVDAATSSSCPPNDQRLQPRPFGPSCDLGAYEASGSTLGLETTLVSETATPEFLTPIFVFTQNALCRSGPSTSYAAINSYNDKDEIEIMARSADNTWFRLIMQAGGHCWVSLVTGEPKGPWQALPVFGAPPTATAEAGEETDEPQPTVTATCYYDLNNNYICP